MRKVAFIGTGGTISSMGAHPLDVQDYGATGHRLHADEIVAMVPELARVAEVIPIRYRNIVSTAIDFADWKALVLACDQAVRDHPDLAGIVIGHGTASLEETAYFLNLTVKVDIPVVLVGSQRPPTALGSDAGPNLVAAVRTAASDDARGMGVMVVLNDEIHAAREVTKTSTLRLQTFRSPDFGVLGHADGDRVAFYRAPLRRRAPHTEFDVRGLNALPRVDITYAYAGSDGTAARAFVAAGTRGIVSAGFAPNAPTPADVDALAQAVQQGVAVVQSTRAGSGRSYLSPNAAAKGFLSADNLNPQKARVLLALALTVTDARDRIAAMFDTY
ncbi:MAG: asparaginase [Janthinobacterium lividum]